jgi:hypothetical protein
MGLYREAVDCAVETRRLDQLSQEGYRAFLAVAYGAHRITGFGSLGDIRMSALNLAI